MKIVAMAMFLGEDKVPLRIGKWLKPRGPRAMRYEDKVPLRIGKRAPARYGICAVGKIKFL
ncbi:hypothetical protein [Cloacibacillus evryensis]|uniref:hypothetical protein n=1 Tax=Cloacibacillus evryensis TaxID=508460 RepID=UPI003C6CABC7